MTKSLRIIPLILLLAGSVFSQQPAWYEALGQYEDGMELFAKGKYGAAQEVFEVFMVANEKVNPRPRENDLLSEAQYYHALCAFHLLRNNAQSLLTQFAESYNTHPKANACWFYVGKLHYIKKNYAEALVALDRVNTSELDYELSRDARFMLGWSYYVQKDLNKSGVIFEALKNTTGIHQDRAAYYYAMIQYERGNYNNALEALKAIRNANENFASQVPVYIANCLLKLEKFDELESYHDTLLASDQRPGSELYLILANARYQKEDYPKAIENFEAFKRKGGGLDRDGKYRMGYAYFVEGEYEKARLQLQNALSPEDAIAQNASYYLGHCFLEMKNFENARTAFRKAANIRKDMELAEDALYQFCKISFETKYFDEAREGFQEMMEDFPNSTHASEAKAIMGEIFVYSGRYKEGIDYFENSYLKDERSKKAYQAACHAYAIDLFGKNLYEMSCTYFKKAFNQHFDPAITLNAYFWYSEGLFRLNNFEDAITYYETFTDQPNAHKHANYNQAFYGIAWSYFKLQKYKQAGRSYEKFIALADRKENPEMYLDAFLRAGDCEFVLENYSNALNYYSQVQDFNSSSVDYAIYQTGICYHRQHRYNESVKAMKKLVDRYKKSDYRDDALIRMSNTYVDFLTDWTNCAKYAIRLIDDYPKSPLVPEAYNLVGVAAANSNDNARAVKNFKKVALEYCQDKTNALTALENLSALLSPPEYDKVFKTHQQRCPSEGGGELCDLQFRTGLDRFYSENYASAVEQFNGYIKDCSNGPEYYDALYYRGMSRKEMDAFDQALADFERVYNSAMVNTMTSDALKAAANLQFERGKFMSAVQLYSNLEDIAGKNDEKVYAQFGKGKTYLAMEDYDLAMEVFMAVYTDANSTKYSKDRAHVQIANCKYYLGQSDDAYLIYSEIEKEYKNAFGAESQYMIAQILYDREEYEQSRDAGLALKDNYATQHYWRARVFLLVAEDYLALGDTFQCKGNLELLAKETRFPEIAEQAQKRLLEILQMENGQGENENRIGDDPFMEEGGEQ